MKVILLKDVPKYGKEKEIREVPDGFAYNFLLPKGLAAIATPEKLKEIQDEESRKIAKRQVQQDLLTKAVQSVNGASVTISRNANAEGVLFEAVHADDIVKAIEKETRVSIESDLLIIPKPIKKVGTYTIDLRLPHMTKKFSITITVDKSK